MTTLGIDIGGTKIAAGVVDVNGKILYEMREETPSSSEAIDETIATMYKNAKNKFDDIIGVGIGVPGFISEDRRTINFAPNICNWKNYPLAENIETLIKNDVPVFVENDANVAGWAEFIFGVAKGSSDMLMLTIGTGLGGAIVIDNKLIKGYHGAAAEIGHMRLVPHGIPCGCGLRGCWEQYASGSALVRKTKMDAFQRPEVAVELLKLANGDIENITGPMITQLAKAGDQFCINMLAELGRWIGEGCSSLVALLDPNVIVIGGGVIAAGDLILNTARHTFSSHLTGRGHRKEAELVPAQFGNDAGIVGAAALAFAPK